MNDKMIYNAFDKMQPLQTDLTGSIMRQIKTNKKHAPVRYRVLKTSVCIMLAACFLLLSVSGYAAVKLITVSLPEPGDSTSELYTVHRNTDVVKINDDAMSDLKHYLVGSEENKDKKSAKDFGRHFNNYAEVDEYLGISILKNSMFGEVPVNAGEKDIILITLGDEKTISVLKISGDHTIPGASAHCYFSVDIKLNDNKIYSSDLMRSSGNAPFIMTKTEI